MARDNEPGMPSNKKLRQGSGRWSKYENREAKNKVSWGDADGDLVLNMLEEVCEAGAAVLLSRSRDGGTLVITLCDGDDRQKWYARNKAEIEEALNEIIKG